MNKKLIYQKLEQKFVKYRDLKKIAAFECGEPLVALANKDGLQVEYQPQLSDMKKFQKGKIFVRKDVRNRLIAAQKYLKRKCSDFVLLVTYGYRLPRIQEKYFRKTIDKLKRRYQKKDDLYEAAHQLIAVPEVAGHPSGGAVDVTIFDEKAEKQVDMGTKIYDFETKDIYTFSPFITRKQEENRLLLRKCMLKAGFVPFDGEWWHFSFGDKEWAYYYKKEFAIYRAIIAKNNDDRLAF